VKNGVRAQQKEQTKQALIREGRRLFATLGYNAVGLSEIVSAAGVTKGALYHHFDSKVSLFRAVLEQVQREVAERIAANADAEADPWSRLTTGCEAFLDATADPDIQRIMLIDGPAVLGWEAWRTIDEEASVQHLTHALSELMESGAIRKQPLVPLTHLLSGAMNEAALWLAQTPDPQSLAETKAVLRQILEGLRVKEPVG